MTNSVLGQEISSTPVTPAATHPSSQLTYEQLPSWRQDNPSLHTGYLPIVKSWLWCARGLIVWHNESVNIWTHLLGAIAVVVLVAISCSKPGFVESNPLELAELLLFLVGAAVCFMSSSAFHASMSHSEEAFQLMNRFDYLGILVLGTLNYMPTFYYAFYCNPTLRNIYSALMAVSGSLGIYLICAPAYATPAYRRMRVLTFVALGFVVVLPFIHALVREGFTELYASIALEWLIIEAVAYLCGATIYAERFPEAWFPEKFDFVGASHQIFHVCSMVAVAAHYVSIWKSYQYWHSGSHSCP